MFSHSAIHEQLADQAQRRYATAARRATPRTDRPPAQPRTMRHGFWHDRVVVTVAIRPAAR